MNLKNLKKVHEDDHVALFRSKDGHECRVSKKGLSEKLRKELASLPLHASEGERIQGNEEGDYTSLPDAPSETAPPQQQEQTGLAPVAKEPQENYVPPSKPEPSGTQQEQQPVASTAPEAPSQQQAEQSKILSQPQITPGEEFAGEIHKYHADVANNIIPKTHQDLLFKNQDGSEKGFMGKMGALFGLMLSGAGSGLAHQENAIMKMMDLEIKNDLEAQKQNQTNAQNYGKLVDNHIETMAAASKNQSDIWHMAINDEGVRDSLKQAYARREALDKFYKDNVLSRREGSPERLRAEQAFATMVNAAAKEDVSAGALINGKAALYGANAKGGAQQGGGDSPVNLNAINELQRKAQLKMPAYPGGPIPSEQNVADARIEAKEVQKAGMLKKEYLHAFDEIRKMPVAERILANKRVMALKEPLMAVATRIAEHRYTQAANDAWSNIMPGKIETIKTAKIKREEGARLFDLIAGPTPTLDSFKLSNKTQASGSSVPETKKPFNDNGASQQQPKPDNTPIKYMDGRSGYWMNGKKMVIGKAPK